MKETIEEAAENSLYSKEHLNESERIIFKQGCVFGAKLQQENNKHIIKILESVQDVTPEHNVYVRGKIIEAIELLKQ